MGWIHIFGFGKNKKAFREKEGNAGLEPPAEVPDLAMDEYPQNDSVSVNSGKSDSIQDIPSTNSRQQPPAEMPSIDHINFEEKNLPKVETSKEEEIASSYSDNMSGDFGQKSEASPNEFLSVSKQEVSSNGSKDVSIENSKDSAKVISRPAPKELIGYNKFFSRIKDKIVNKKKVDVQKIFEDMKDYHKYQSQKMKIETKKIEVDNEISRKLWELEMLEEGWYLLKREIETKQQMLIEKEKSIDIKIREFQEVMEKAKGTDKKIIPRHKWFVMHNGQKISSIDELKDMIKVIDDHIYTHHVNEQKNDFSSWIRNVFDDVELADKIVAAQSKEELINILENVA